MQLQALMKHNEQSYKNAIQYPDLRRGHHSLELTVPKEFTLSASNRPVFRGDGDSSVEWTSALRKPSVPESPGRGRSGWTPELTVPKAPTLRTSSRHRSNSASRSGSDSHRSMSKHSLPREQAAIERHLQRSTYGVASSTVVGSAEKRAERAREEAQSRHEEALAEEKKRLCVFRPAKGKGGNSSATEGITKEAPAGGA